MNNTNDDDENNNTMSEPNTTTTTTGAVTTTNVVANMTTNEDENQVVLLEGSLLSPRAENNNDVASKTENNISSNNSSSSTAAAVEAKAAWYTLPLFDGTMNISSWVHVSIGVILVTFITPSLSNYAIFQIALGLQLTLSSTGPLYQLPISYIMQKQIPTIRSVLGAILAVSGIVILAFRGTLPNNEEED